MNKLVIGLCGLIGSGKNTAGEILQKCGYTPVSFADSLKDAASDIFGWNREMLEGSTKESREWREQIDPFWSKELDKPNFTPRLALQWLGTEAGRNIFGDKLWIASAFKKVYDSPNNRFVITDTRFKNEIREIEKLPNGKIVAIFRGDPPIWFQTASRKPAMMPDWFPDVHISEYDWINMRYDIIQNNGTLQELEESVIRLAASYESNLK